MSSEVEMEDRNKRARSGGSSSDESGPLLKKQCYNGEQIKKDLFSHSDSSLESSDMHLILEDGIDENEAVSEKQVSVKETLSCNDVSPSKSNAKLESKDKDDSSPLKSNSETNKKISREEERNSLLCNASDISCQTSIETTKMKQSFVSYDIDSDSYMDADEHNEVDIVCEKNVKDIKSGFYGKGKHGQLKYNALCESSSDDDVPLKTIASLNQNKGESKKAMCKGGRKEATLKQQQTEEFEAEQVSEDDVLSKTAENICPKNSGGKKAILKERRLVAQAERKGRRKITCVESESESESESEDNLPLKAIAKIGLKKDNKKKMSLYKEREHICNLKSDTDSDMDADEHNAIDIVCEKNVKDIKSGFYGKGKHGQLKYNALCESSSDDDVPLKTIASMNQNKGKSKKAMCKGGRKEATLKQQQTEEFEAEQVSEDDVLSKTAENICPKNSGGKKAILKERRLVAQAERKGKRKITCVESESESESEDNLPLKAIAKIGLKKDNKKKMSHYEEREYFRKLKSPCLVEIRSVGKDDLPSKDAANIKKKQTSKKRESENGKKGQKAKIKVSSDSEHSEEDSGEGPSRSSAISDSEADFNVSGKRSEADSRNSKVVVCGLNEKTNSNADSDFKRVTSSSDSGPDSLRDSEDSNIRKSGSCYGNKKQSSEVDLKRTSDSSSDSGPDPDSDSDLRRGKQAGSNKMKTKMNKENRESPKSKSTSRKSKGVINSEDPHQDPTIIRLKKYLHAAGIRVRYGELWKECSSHKSRAKKLTELLEKAGIDGRPTLQKCRKIKKKKETETELAELSKNTIINHNKRALRKRQDDNSACESPHQLNKIFQRIKAVFDSDSD